MTVNSVVQRLIRPLASRKVRVALTTVVVAFAAELGLEVSDELVPIANAKDWYRELEYPLIELRCIVLIYRKGSAGKNNSFNTNIMRKYF